MLTARRVNFEYLGLQVDIVAADPKLNPVFRAACMAHLRPFELAASLGRLREDMARQQLIKAYAEGVIIGSPSPELEKLDVQGWINWLQDHPDEFDTIKGLAEVTSNFEDEEGDDVRAP